LNKNFSGKFGEIQPKVLRTPKNLLAPTPMTLNPTLVKACTRPQTNPNVREFSREIKCDCNVQGIRKNVNNLTASKCVIRGLKNRNVALNPMTTSTRSPR